jgi:hypothetical protein
MHLSIYLSVYLFIYLYIYLFIYISIYLSIIKGSSTLSKNTITFDTDLKESNQSFLSLMKMKQYITVRLTVDIPGIIVF